MPSGWEVYYVVFLAALLALCIPISLRLISRTVSRNTPKSPEAPVLELKTDKMSPGKKINTRFFLGANAALILISLMLILVPCVVVIRSSVDRESALKALTCVLSLSGFATLALLYSSRKGDLNWLRSYRSTESRRDGT